MIVKELYEDIPLFRRNFGPLVTFLDATKKYFIISANLVFYVTKLTQTSCLSVLVTFANLLFLFSDTFVIKFRWKIILRKKSTIGLLSA